RGGGGGLRVPRAQRLEDRDVLGERHVAAAGDQDRAELQARETQPQGPDQVGDRAAARRLVDRLVERDVRRRVLVPQVLGQGTSHRLDVRGEPRELLVRDVAGGQRRGLGLQRLPGAQGRSEGR